MAAVVLPASYEAIGTTRGAQPVVRDVGFWRVFKYPNHLCNSQMGRFFLCVLLDRIGGCHGFRAAGITFWPVTFQGTLAISCQSRDFRDQIGYLI